MPPGAAAVVVDFTPIGLNHFGDEIDDALRVVELVNAPARTFRVTLAGCLCRSAPVCRFDGAAELVGGVPEGFFEEFRSFFGSRHSQNAR